MTPQDFVDYSKKFIGLPYIWGANGPDAYDCSGLAQKLLAYIALDPPGDQTAKDLFLYFKDAGRSVPVSQPAAQCGTLVFYGTPSRVGHVAICLDNVSMIEAGKGGPDTTSVEKARARHAEVMISAINRRSDIVAFLTPKGLPWDSMARVTASVAPFHAELAAAFLPTIATAIPLAAASLSAEDAAIRTYRTFILQEASNYRVDPYVILGIGSRESNWGTNPLMKPSGPTGTGDRARRRATPNRPAGLPPDGLGFGRGLMQVDWDAHEFARTGRWQDPEANIGYGCRVLRDSLALMTRNLGNWPQADILTAAVAGYNAGPGRILRAVARNGVKAADPLTAHGNYASDVLSRAAAFRTTNILG